MIRILITLMMLVVSIFGFSQTTGKEKESSITITVNVNEIRSPHGTFYISLYDSEMNFLTRTAVDRKELKIEENSITVDFKNIKKGEYAIGCFHDENDNKKMDFYESGMPKENYGMSNNKVYYGPPTFSDAKFEVKGYKPYF